VTEHSFTNVFRGKRVLITGHTGFKGSWLSLWLSTLGAEVYGYSLAPPTSPNMFEDTKIESLLAKHIIADVRDEQKLLNSFSKIQPEIVFHLAAQPLVRLSYDQPVETYSTNVIGTVNLLEAVRKTNSIRVCQIITSDKCYENREWIYPYRENDPMGGHDPYSCSKGCAELVVSSYRNSFFHDKHQDKHSVSISSVRAGNVIGGGDWAADRIMPDCIKALVKSKIIKIRNPLAVRPWQHVLEPLSGYLWLAAKQYIEPHKYNQGWNFGPTDEGNVNVAKIASMIVKQWGAGSWKGPNNEAREVHEANVLKLDISQSRTLLGWFPVWSIEQTVKATVEWYRTYQTSLDTMPENNILLQLSLQQIENYTENASTKDLPWTAERQNG